MGSAVLVGVLCCAVLFGLSVVRGTAPMAGVAHSERGPSSASAGTSTAAASPSLLADPEASDVVLPPRGSSRGGIPAAPLVPVPVTPAVAPPVEEVVAPPTTDEPAEVVSEGVHQGAYCKRAAVGQAGYTSSGTEMICEYGDGEDQPRWRAAGGEAAESTTVESTTTTKKPPATQSTNEPSESPEQPIQVS